MGQIKVCTKNNETDLSDLAKAAGEMVLLCRNATKYRSKSPIQIREGGIILCTKNVCKYFLKFSKLNFAFILLCLNPLEGRR